MAEAVDPSGGLPPVDPTQGADDGDPQKMVMVFPGMPFTPEEYKEFMKNLFQSVTNQIKHDMKRMKEAYQKMKQEIERYG